MKKWFLFGITLIFSVTGSSSAFAAEGETLEAIKNRGHLLCGADGKRAGFSAPDSNGVWQGFDVDFCRAIAAAIANAG